VRAFNLVGEKMQPLDKLGDPGGTRLTSSPFLLSQTGGGAVYVYGIALFAGNYFEGNAAPRGGAVHTYGSDNTSFCGGDNFTANAAQVQVGSSTSSVLACDFGSVRPSDPIRFREDSVQGFDMQKVGRSDCGVLSLPAASLAEPVLPFARWENGFHDRSKTSLCKKIFCGNGSYGNFKQY
jgi:hypothetical protein